MSLCKLIITHWQRSDSHRLALFNGTSVIAHEPGSGQMSFKWHKQNPHTVNNSDNTQCTSLFIEPAGWMLPMLEGTVDGKVSFDNYIHTAYY